MTTEPQAGGPQAVILDGTGLTPQAVAAVARGGASVSLSPTAARATRLRAALHELLVAGWLLYGVTTGVGAPHTARVASSDLKSTSDDWCAAMSRRARASSRRR
jgi:histidine ammonia-lyase